MLLPPYQFCLWILSRSLQDGGGKLSCDRVGGRGFVWKSLQRPAEIHWSGLFQLPDDHFLSFCSAWYLFLHVMVLWFVWFRSTWILVVLHWLGCAVLQKMCRLLLWSSYWSMARAIRILKTLGRRLRWVLTRGFKLLKFWKYSNIAEKQLIYIGLSCSSV